MSSNLLKSLFCKVIPQIYFFKGLGLIFLLLTSCNSTLYYRPVMLNLDRTYLPKPMLSDSSSSLYGLSGSYINTESNASFSAISDEQQVYELNFTAAYIFKKVQIAYGGYLFWGQYANGAIQEGSTYYFDKKSFNGYGIRGSINLFQADGRFEFRFPGIEFSYSKEVGAFAQFRKSLINQDLYYTNPKTELLTLGISNEVAWRNYRNENIYYAARLFIGHTFGDLAYYNNKSTVDGPKKLNFPMVFDASFIFGLKQFYIVSTLTSLSSVKISMGYAFRKRSKK